MPARRSQHSNKRKEALPKTVLQATDNAPG
jgi:hypothetical protein